MWLCLLVVSPRAITDRKSKESHLAPTSHFGASLELYADRTARGDLDHRIVDRSLAAGATGGKATCKGPAMRNQHAHDQHRNGELSQR